jgi:tripeptide aminopeptidase
MQSDNVSQLFLDLARIDSPSGFESQFADYLNQRLIALGFRTRIDSAGNLFGFNDKPGQPVLINAHMDTVEPGRNIQPRIVNGRIVSDGTTIVGADNKAALAAILSALETAGPDSLRPLEILFTVREETDSGVKQFDLSQLNSRTGLTADRASTIGSIVLASPWILSLQLKITGKSAHSSLPERGINTVNVAAAAISKTTWGRVDPDTTTNLGLVSGGTAVNCIPGETTLIGEIRSFSREKLYEVDRHIKAVFSAEARANKAKLTYTSSLYCPGYKYEKSTPAVKEIAALFTGMGIKPRYEIAFGASDVNFVSSKNIHLVNIADGCKNPHTVNESIGVQELELLKTVFLRYITSA